LERSLGDLGDCAVVHGRAIVSIIGEGMKNQVWEHVCVHGVACGPDPPWLMVFPRGVQVGVAARMFTCLANVGINFEMITQGASEINLTVVIEAEQAGGWAAPFGWLPSKKRPCGVAVMVMVGGGGL
jgi:aspartate kinase